MSHRKSRRCEATKFRHGHVKSRTSDRRLIAGTITKQGLETSNKSGGTPGSEAGHSDNLWGNSWIRKSFPSMSLLLLLARISSRFSSRWLTSHWAVRFLASRVSEQARHSRQLGLRRPRCSQDADVASLGQQFFARCAFVLINSFGTALVEVNHLSVIKSKQPHHSAVQVVDVQTIFDGM